jgi:NTE family protein
MGFTLESAGTFVMRSQQHSRGATGLGWVLAGGGARGAYEVGVLSYVFERIARDLDRALPLDVVSGSSIGAIHALALATWADDPRVGLRMLTRRWADLSLDDVVRLDRRRSFNMIRALLGWPLRRPSPDAERGGVLDPRPLDALLSSMMDADRVADHLLAGRLSAVSVTATHVGTGRTTVFYQRAQNAGDGELPWQSRRARAFPVTLATEHALASAAIPFLFPAVRIEGELYCDGSLRQHVPLSPARLLGARALVVINPRATNALTGELSPADRERAFPGPLFLLGKMLNALTLDRIDADVEQHQLINRLLLAGERRFGPGFVRELNGALAQMGATEVRPLPLLQISASEDIGKLAAGFVRTPRFRRRCSTLLDHAFARLADGEAANEADLLSYLLFDGAFAGELIALGRRDARQRHDEIAEFFRSQVVVEPAPRPAFKAVER